MVLFPAQFYSNRELEDQLTKIRDVLSDDKHDWELRVAAVRVTTRPLVDPWTQRWSTGNTVMPVMFLLYSWRRSDLSCWLGQSSLRAFLSNYVFLRLPSNCRLKTCGRRWSGRPVSHWGKSPRRENVLACTDGFGLWQLAVRFHVFYRQMWL